MNAMVQAPGNSAVRPAVVATASVTLPPRIPENHERKLAEDRAGTPITVQLTNAADQKKFLAAAFNDMNSGSQALTGSGVSKESFKKSAMFASTPTGMNAPIVKTNAPGQGMGTGVRTV